MRARVLIGALALAALIHLLPLPGLLGGGALAQLYALPPPDPASALLLRHRAWMFALDAALLLWAIRTPALRAPAIALTLASDIGFLALCAGGLPAGLLRVAAFDGLSILALVVAARAMRRVPADVEIRRAGASTSRPTTGLRNTTMKYILLIYGDPTAEAALDEAGLQSIYAAHEAYGRALEEAGVLRGGAELKPPATATTVRFSGGRSVLVDGPYAETKEHLGGYYLIETGTLDEALDWAAKLPMVAGAGAVEVRPLGLGG